MNDIFASTGVDPRIGVLIREGQTIFYAFVKGYARPPVEGSLDVVQRALEATTLPEAVQRRDSRLARPARTYRVTVTPRMVTYAGSTVNGPYVVEVLAHSREQAIQQARADRRLQEGRYGVPATYRAHLLRDE